MRPIYGGALVDEVNGVPPFKLPVFGVCDANVTLFTTAVIILMTGCALLGSVAFVVEELTQAAL
jgi:hypothetical protein